MKRTGDRLKIGALEGLSGVGRSTIHHYVNLGLLPRPHVAGPRLHLFDGDHLARLLEIRRLRDEGRSLERIREHLLHFGVPASAPDADADDATDSMRGRILEQASLLFAERGYEAVRLTDISRALGIGKATIYRHFDSKHALFVACVESVRMTLIPAEARERNERAGDLLGQGRRRAAAVLQHHDAYRSLTQLLGALAHGSDPRLQRQARGELHAMITNAEPYLRRLIDAGLIRAADPELLAYMLWGALMGAGERLAHDARYTFDQVLEGYMDFVQQGLGGVAPTAGSVAP